MGDQQPAPLEAAPPIPIRDRTIPVVDGLTSCIIPPPLRANTCDIKTCIQMIQLSVQFGGSPLEDPNAHISSFLEICNTFNYDKGSEEAVRLRVFPYSLKDRAKGWLHSLPAGSVTTWTDLATKFLSKYFPPARTAKLRNDITSFMQLHSESLHEAWERFKDLLRKCPHHEIAKWLQVQTFYNGLNEALKTTVDAAAGGALMAKGEDQAWELLDEMANNNSLWPTERRAINRADTMVEDKLERITKCLEVLTRQTASNAGAIYRGQNEEQYQLYGESVNYVNNYNRQGHNSFPNNYNPGWKNNQGVAQQGYEAKPSVEDMMVNLLKKQEEKYDALFRNQLTLMQNQASLIQNQAASLKALETQVGQLASGQYLRPHGTLPSDIEPNPRGQSYESCKAITLRSGIVIDEGPQLPEKEEDKVEEKRQENESNTKEISTDYPPPPYPQRLQKTKLEKQFMKFLEIFKKLHINIPFAEALEQMPSYVKFLKEILSKKRKLNNFETVALTEECSAILQRKLPPKLKDPGSFTIPCTIGDRYFGKALCDLGASVNLMPLSIYKKLGLGEAKPTTVKLQLADRSVTYPRGIIEDVLVKVDKFVFPADFIVLDMEEDCEVPIILGRPFLATGRTLIDVQKGELTMRVQDREVTFHVFKAMPSPQDEEECYQVGSTDSGAHDKVDKNHRDYGDEEYMLKMPEIKDGITRECMPDHPTSLLMGAELHENFISGLLTDPGGPNDQCSPSTNCPSSRRNKKRWIIKSNKSKPILKPP